MTNPGSLHCWCRILREAGGFDDSKCGPCLARENEKLKADLYVARERAADLQTELTILERKLARRTPSLQLQAFGVTYSPQATPPVEDVVCEHGTAMDVHCCHCHSGFIFDKDHKCEERDGDR